MTDTSSTDATAHHPPIAFLGLGRMGLPMAGRLVDAGFPVTLWNRSANRAAALRGARRVATTPADAVSGAAVVVLMLADPAAVNDVLTGDAGVASALGHGTLVIDCSTVGPLHASEFAATVRNAAGRFVEAPVIGSVPAAKGGTLTVLAGGDAADVDAAEPVLRRFGKVVRTGTTGSANALKLVMNLLVGGITELLSEALVLAEHSGLSRDVVRETLLASVLKSPFIEYKAPQLFDRQFAPLFTTGLMLKDLDLVLEHAKAVEVKLPATHSVRDAYAAAASSGHRDEDFAAVITTIEGGARR